MLHRTLARFAFALVAVAAAAALAGATAAWAQTYAGGLSVSNTSPSPGTQVTVRAAGVAPNQPTQVLFDSTPLATTTADANGVATKVVTIPPTASNGQHLIAVAHSSRGRRAVLLTRSVDVAVGGDAFSRSDGGGVSGVLVALLVAGAALTTVVLRRRPLRH